MKKLVSIAIAAAMLGTPLYAQDYAQDRNIIVEPSEDAFVTTLGHRLERELDRVSYPSGVRQSGVVKVRFVANGSGEAEQVSLFQNSGNRRMDLAALRAVDRLHGLGSPRHATDDGQAVLLNIIFATSEREAERLAERVAEETATMIASGELDPQMLAITMVPARS